MSTQDKKQLLERVRNMENRHAQNVLATLVMNLAPAKKTVLKELQEAMNNTLSLFWPSPPESQQAQAEESDDDNDGADTSGEDTKKNLVNAKKRKGTKKKDEKDTTSKKSRSKKSLSEQHSDAEVEDNVPVISEETRPKKQKKPKKSKKSKEPKKSTLQDDPDSNNETHDQQSEAAKSEKAEKRKGKSKSKKVMNKPKVKLEGDSEQEAESLDADDGGQTQSPQVSKGSSTSRAKKRQHENEDAAHPSSKAKRSRMDVSDELGEDEEANASHMKDPSPSEEQHKRKAGRKTSSGGGQNKHRGERKEKVANGHDKKEQSAIEHKRPRTEEDGDQGAQETHSGESSRTSAKKQKPNPRDKAAEQTTSGSQAGSGQHEQDSQQIPIGEPVFNLRPRPPPQYTPVPVGPPAQIPTPGPSTAPTQSPSPDHHTATPPPPHRSPEQRGEPRVKQEVHVDEDIQIFGSPTTPFRKDESKAAVKTEQPSLAKREEPPESINMRPAAHGQVGQHRHLATQPSDTSIASASGRQVLTPGDRAPQVQQWTPAPQQQRNPFLPPLSTPRGERRFRCKHCSDWFKYSDNKVGSCPQQWHPGKYSIYAEYLPRHLSTFGRGSN